MALYDDLSAETVKILKEAWTTRDGQKVPDTSELKLANDAVKLTGTVLYADMADSTGLVQGRKASFAAEVFKVYLSAACRIIKDKGGEITAFDGDRVMAVFLGDTKNSNAVRAALGINHAVVNILNPKLKECYPSEPTFTLKHGVGIDTSDLYVARTGVRGANDLVWVGRAANLAAKLASLREGDYPLWITSDVFGNLNESVKKYTDGRALWEAMTWKAQGGMSIYRSSWRWAL